MFFLCGFFFCLDVTERYEPKPKSHVLFINIETPVTFSNMLKNVVCVCLFLFHSDLALRLVSSLTVEYAFPSCLEFLSVSVVLDCNLKVLT